MNGTSGGSIWRKVFWGCTLVYAVWVIWLGMNDFRRVHREYQRAEKRTAASWVRETALQELREECRRRLEHAGGRAAGDGAREEARPGKGDGEEECRTWPAQVVVERERAVASRQEELKERAGNKLLLFSLSFVLVFLVLPPAFVYLTASFVVRMWRSLGEEEGDRR